MNKKLPMAVVLLAVLAALTIFLLRRSPERRLAEPVPQTGTTPEPAQTPPEAVVFALKYCPLTGPDDPLGYRSFWGFGGRDENDDPFVRAVRKQVDDGTLVYNRPLAQSQWSVVALEEGKPVALYFDTDANGKLSADEKILPAPASEQRSGFPYAFVTPDFPIRSEDKEIPCRLLLVANRYGDDKLSFMWSPCCVLEGQNVLDGEPMRLFLYSDGPCGSFTTFRGSSYALVPAKKKLEGYIGRHTLSSLINHKGTFYRVQLIGTHAKSESLQAVLTEDTTPTGRLAITLTAQEGLESRLTSAVIEGTTDETVHFSVSGAESVFPVGDYKLSSGQIRYETDGQSWNAHLSNGPTFAIRAETTNRVELGRPELSVRAIDQKDRYTGREIEKSTYGENDTVYIEPQIKGKRGEVYTRFSRNKPDSRRREDVKPHLLIRDSNGTEIASTDLEYG